MRPTDDNASGDHYVIDNATSNHNLDDTHPNYHPNPHLHPIIPPFPPPLTAPVAIM